MMGAAQRLPVRRAGALEAIFAGPGSAYALLDAARSPRVLRLIKSFDGAQILYEGHVAPEIAAVAPYLVPAPQKGLVAEQLVSWGWGESWGVFLKTSVAPHELRHHLRRFLTVKTEAGKRMLFRFYDPRVLRVYLPTCTPKELQELFGPIERFVMEARDPSRVLVHRRDQAVEQLDAGGSA